MRKCEACQYEHNHASNELCQRCKATLNVSIQVAEDESEEGGEA